MTANGPLKNLLHIRGAVVDSFDLGENAKGEPSLVVHVHVGKGHSYITVAVNHDTNTVVWAHRGHGKEIIEAFFGELTEERRASILLVPGDGARWIADAAKDFRPNAGRGHAMKEKLRLVFKLTDPALAEEELDGWLGWAQRCRIPAFVELGRKVRRHRELILDTVRNGLSNVRIEATNNKVKLPLRVAYGFRNIDTMIGLVMLFCSSIEIPWPGRKQKEPTNKGSTTTQAA